MRQHQHYNRSAFRCQRLHRPLNIELDPAGRARRLSLWELFIHELPAAGLFAGMIGISRISDLKEPAFGSGRIAKRPEPVMGANECILCKIIGQGRIAGQAAQESSDRTLMGTDQRFICGPPGNLIVRGVAAKQEPEYAVNQSDQPGE